MSESTPSARKFPLLVPVEGVLIHTDLLAEAVARLARLKPGLLPAVPLWLVRGGRAAVLARAAKEVEMGDLGAVFSKPVAAFVEKAMTEGREVIFLAPEATAAKKFLGARFADCTILTPTDGMPSGGDKLADALEKRFGPRGYDFIGGPHFTHAALARAREAHAATRLDRPAHLAGARRQVADLNVLDTVSGTTWKDWLAGLRFHQWVKNLLLFVPFLSGHHYEGPHQIAGLLTAFVSMGLCASATYLWNDMLDIEFDRLHANKRKRLLASGRTSLARAFWLSIALVIVGLAGGFILSPVFGGVLVFYIVLTVAYSTFLKRLALVDLFVLTSLYLTRIVAGVVVGKTIPSFWLFAFSFLFFLSLAAAKRRIELHRHAPEAGGVLRGRGYDTGDAKFLSGLGISTGIAAALMLALYSDSAHVRSLYARPEWLWGACVLCLFWICRVWLLTERGRLQDDPVVFAMTDKITLLIAALGGLIFLLAQPI
ncbi:MAG: UbiA family prenyltransferase [Verrucomicrobiales bacterium]